VAQKLVHFCTPIITSSNIDRFSNLFHCQNQEKICDYIIIKYPTASQVCRYHCGRYTALCNVSVLN